MLKDNGIDTLFMAKKEVEGMKQPIRLYFEPTDYLDEVGHFGRFKKTIDESNHLFGLMHHPASLSLVMNRLSSSLTHFFKDATGDGALGRKIVDVFVEKVLPPIDIAGNDVATMVSEIHGFPDDLRFHIAVFRDDENTNHYHVEAVMGFGQGSLAYMEEKFQINDTVPNVHWAYRPLTFG